MLAIKSFSTILKPLSVSSKTSLRSFSTITQMRSAQKVQKLVRRELTPLQVTNHVMNFSFLQKNVTALWDTNTDKNMIKLKEKFTDGAVANEFVYFAEGLTPANVRELVTTPNVYPLEDTEVSLLTNYALDMCYLMGNYSDEGHEARKQFIINLKTSPLVQKSWARHKSVCFGKYPQDIQTIELLVTLDAKAILANALNLQTMDINEPWIKFFRLSAYDLLKETTHPLKIKTIVSNLLEKPCDHDAQEKFLFEALCDYRSMVSAKIFKQTLPKIPPHFAVVLSYGSLHRESFLQELAF